MSEELEPEALAGLKARLKIALSDLEEIERLIQEGKDPFFPGAGAIEIEAKDLKILLDCYEGVAPAPDALREAAEKAYQTIVDEADTARLDGYPGHANNLMFVADKLRSALSGAGDGKGE